MSEIAKCAWCRYEPVKLWGNDRPTTYTCGDVKKDICPSAIQRPLPLDEWNLTQVRILEARRKDFDAGWCANLMQLGGRGPAYSAGGPYFDAAFDDYIKGEI